MLPTIQTYTGRFINFVDHTNNFYSLEDISHSLAHLCRYTGHCDTFYSVAQHCVLASYLVPKVLAFETLMHDRIEAYMDDMSSPLKNLLPEFKKIEKSLDEHSAIQYVLLQNLHQKSSTLTSSCSGQKKEI